MEIDHVQVSECVCTGAVRVRRDQSNYTKVGVAFPHDKGGGFNLKITNGISVSGDLVVFPPKETENS